VSRRVVEWGEQGLCSGRQVREEGRRGVGVVVEEEEVEGANRCGRPFLLNFRRLRVFVSATRPLWAYFISLVSLSWGGFLTPSFDLLLLLVAFHFAPRLMAC
jgi:hypothetical protein